ncbi:MAG: hypothetical protein J6Z29_05225 [Ruminococcus sp.]|nr:hypothetical protein [Ruminococcus sp.]
MIKMAILWIIQMFTNFFGSFRRKQENGDISREEYDQWRYRYPRSEAERNEAELKEKKGE